MAPAVLQSITPSYLLRRQGLVDHVFGAHGEGVEIGDHLRTGPDGAGRWVQVGPPKLCK
jgi:hypothetical protein